MPTLLSAARCACAGWQPLEVTGPRGAGTLDPGWANLTSFATQLTLLNISTNAIRGTLPATWASSFGGLLILDLSINALSGQPPLLLTSRVAGMKLLWICHPAWALR